MSDDLPPLTYLDQRPPNLADLIDSVTDALPPPPGAGLDERLTHGEKVVAELEALEPHDALETMVAGQVVIARRNASACFSEASKAEFASKEAAALRREGLAHQRVMLSAARLLAKTQQRFAPPKTARAATPAAEDVPQDGRDPDRWQFAKPLPPEFSEPLEPETVDADGKIVPPRCHHLPLEYMPVKLQEIYQADPSLKYLRDNWGNYRGWEHMSKEERLKMFGYKHSEWAKKHLMNKPEGEAG